MPFCKNALKKCKSFHADATRCRSDNDSCFNIDEATELRPIGSELSELLAKHWISVNDSLPGDGKPYAFYWCLVCKENRVVMEGQYNNKVCQFMRLDFSDFNHKITHWMPLPDPPKAG
ncbi:DUF551 domain-containing protein [Sulfurovum sp.]|uniref:DUF551 domain-containing protein n=1 Tax=Sulfurovum sp. TaxID=1969726 RepID=UPI00356227D0